MNNGSKLISKSSFEMSKLAKKIKKAQKAKTGGVVGVIIINASNKDTKYIDIKLVSTGLNHVEIKNTLQRGLGLLIDYKKSGMPRDDIDVDGYVTIITTTDPKNIDVKVIPYDLTYGYVEYAIRQGLLLSKREKPDDTN